MQDLKLKLGSLFFALFFLLPILMKAQAQEEDPDRLIREVIEIQVEKPKAVAPPPPSEDNTAKGKKGKKKNVEEPAPEPPPDEGGTIPAPASELAKRAGSWAKLKNKTFEKNNVTNSGSTVSCVAVFAYKPKELNTICDVEGQISMDVIIECKEGKYRYTIKNIRHTSRNPNVNGGDVYNEIPDCGTIPLNLATWRQIKGMALVDAKIVAQDLKARMFLPGEEKKDEW